MSPSVVPEPCPLDLDLRLEPGGRFVFVSDLHLTDPGPSDDFAATAELCDLLGSLQSHPGQVVLALGGDVLDLLQVAGSPEERVARVLDGPAAGPIGRALRRLAARPGATVLYLLSPFLGRSFRRAAAAYGLPTPDEAADEAQARKGDLPELLQRRDPT